MATKVWLQKACISESVFGNITFFLAASCSCISFFSHTSGTWTFIASHNFSKKWRLIWMPTAILWKQINFWSFSLRTLIGQMSIGNNTILEAFSEMLIMLALYGNLWQISLTLNGDLYCISPPFGLLQCVCVMNIFHSVGGSERLTNYKTTYEGSLTFILF